MTSFGSGPYQLLGVHVHAMTVDELFATIEHAITHHERWVIGNHNLHSVHLYHHDEALRQFCDEADRIFIDGMPLVFAGRLLGLPIHREHRSTSADWMTPLLRRAEECKWRVFLIGARPNVVQRAAGRIRRAMPGLQLDVSHGYFDASPGSVGNEAVLEQIRRFRPDLVVVGMGMPRQERWILENRQRIGAHAVLNLGAIIDYLADEVPMPPRWMAGLGLEWLGRLATEPRRLWRRYLVEPWSLMPFLLADLRQAVAWRRTRQVAARGRGASEDGIGVDDAALALRRGSRYGEQRTFE